MHPYMLSLQDVPSIIEREQSLCGATFITHGRHVTRQLFTDFGEACCFKIDDRDSERCYAWSGKWII